MLSASASVDTVRNEYEVSLTPAEGPRGRVGADGGWFRQRQDASKATPIAAICASRPDVLAIRHGYSAGVRKCQGASGARSRQLRYEMPDAVEAKGGPGPIELSKACRRRLRAWSKSAARSAARPPGRAGPCLTECRAAGDAAGSWNRRFPSCHSPACHAYLLPEV
jgi:hypothetical protein